MLPSARVLAAAAPLRALCHRPPARSALDLGARAVDARAWGGLRARVATDLAPLVCASASRCVPGAHTCALLDDKSVKCFGFNGYGRLGLGDTTHRTTPTAVSALGTSVAQIALGGAHACGAACTCRPPRLRTRCALCEPLCHRPPAHSQLTASPKMTTR